MKKRVGVLGCGRLGGRIAEELSADRVDGAELAAVLTRSGGGTGSYSMTTQLADFIAAKPDIVMEAATAEALREYAVPILRAGADLIVLSTSAFADPGFFRQVQAAAEQYDRHVSLVPGVIGGLDLAEAAALMGGAGFSLTKQKFPRGSQSSDVSLDTLPDHFQSSAAEAGAQYPGQLNVAVSLGLAAGDLERTRITVSPGDSVAFHMQCVGRFGTAEVRVELGNAGPELAAWSALAMLRRSLERIHF